MVACPLQSALSQHAFRAHRRHAARLRQEAIITELRAELVSAKGELKSWWSWWQAACCYNSDYYGDCDTCSDPADHEQTAVFLSELTSCDAKIDETKLEDDSSVAEPSDAMPTTDAEM